MVYENVEEAAATAAPAARKVLNRDMELNVERREFVEFTCILRYVGFSVIWRAPAMVWEVPAIDWKCSSTFQDTTWSKESAKKSLLASCDNGNAEARSWHSTCEFIFCVRLLMSLSRGSVLLLRCFGCATMWDGQSVPLAILEGF